MLTRDTLLDSSPFHHPYAFSHKGLQIGFFIPLLVPDPPPPLLEKTSRACFPLLRVSTGHAENEAVSVVAEVEDDVDAFQELP